MPLDFRRINGPDNSVPYRLYSKLHLETFNTRFSKVVSARAASKRDSFRCIAIKPDVVTEAKGSAYMEMGNTKVIVSVYDPREIPTKSEYSECGELFCEFKFATFSCPKRRMHQRDVQEKEYSVVFKRALDSAVCRDQFPNFQVDIYALVLENDGAALSTAIMCAGVALAQAGIPMYDVITCATIAKQGDHVFVDPTRDEEVICNEADQKTRLSYDCLKLQAGTKVLKEFSLCSNVVSDEQKTDVLSDERKIDVVSDADSYEDSDEETPRKVKAVKLKSVDSQMDTSDALEQKVTPEHGMVLLSYLHTHEQITEIYQTGSMTVATIKELTTQLLDINKQLLPYVQKTLVKYVQKQMQEVEE